MADNIFSYIDQLNPTSALIGASNMLLNRLQATGVVPRADGSYVPRSKKINIGQKERLTRRGTAFRDDQPPVTGGMFQRGRVYGDLDAVAPIPGQGMFQRGRVYGDLNAVAPEMRSAPQTAPPISIAPATLNGIAGIVDVDPNTGKGIPGTWRRGDMDAGPGLVSEMNDPSQADYITPPLAPILPPPPGLPPEERAYQAELARTQQMMASNPYMPQMNLYAQGQRAMQTPEDMAATRDLGLAVNRSMYGDVLTPKTPNPLMAGLTPPPGAQPNIPMDQEGRIGQLDTAAEGVQEFMRKYLEGKKKREEED